MRCPVRQDITVIGFLSRNTNEYFNIIYSLGLKANQEHSQCLTVYRDAIEPYKFLVALRRIFA